MILRSSISNSKVLSISSWFLSTKLKARWPCQTQSFIILESFISAMQALEILHGITENVLGLDPLLLWSFSGYPSSGCSVIPHRCEANCEICTHNLTRIVDVITIYSSKISVIENFKHILGKGDETPSNSTKSEKSDRKLFIFLSVSLLICHVRPPSMFSWSWGKILLSKYWCRIPVLVMRLLPFYH
jgi:hypothetical protein